MKFFISTGNEIYLKECNKKTNMEVVIKQSPIVLEGKKGSFILHCLDEEDLAIFRKSSPGLAKNTLIIRDRKPKTLKKNEFFMTSGEWKAKLDQNIELTRGAFVVLDNVKDSESEYIRRMEFYKQHYPVVFVSYHSSDADYLTSSLPGWKKKTAKNYQVTMYVNKNWKEFETFEVNFKKLFNKDSGVGALVTTEIDVDDRGGTFVREVFSGKDKKKTGIVSEKRKPISVRKPSNTEANWSIFEGLPQPSMKPDHSSSVWVKEFYIYLKDLMTRIVPKGKENLVNILVNKKTIDNYWLDVFTSPFYNPNSGENYDTYEAVGDSGIKYVLYIYLMEKFGSTISASQLNNIKTDHLSTPWQAKLSQKMGLSEWMLVPEILRHNAKIEEDLSEALVGGIESILNTKMRGLSTMVVLNMVQLLFQDYDFKLGDKMDNVLTPDVSKLDQWYSQVAAGKKGKERIVVTKPRSLPPKDWENLLKKFNQTAQNEGIMLPVSEKDKERGFKVVSYINEKGIQISEVYLNKSGIEVLQNRGLPVHKLKDGLLARVSGRPSKLIEKNARSKAWDKMVELGVTQEFLDGQKKQKSQTGIERLEEALIVAREIDPEIVEVVPKKLKELDNHVVYQLQGIRKDGKLAVLETLIAEKGVKGKSGNWFQDVVDQFVLS